MTIRDYERRLIAGAIIQNPSSEVLLVRMRAPAPDAPSRWTLPSVEAEPWETSSRAVRRAVRKRAGLVVTPRNLAFAIEWREDGPGRSLAVYLSLYFAADVEGPVIDHRRDPEVLEVRWIPPDGAVLLVTPVAVRTALGEWLATGAGAFIETIPEGPT